MSLNNATKKKKELRKWTERFKQWDRWTKHFVREHLVGTFSSFASHIRGHCCKVVKCILWSTGTLDLMTSPVSSPYFPTDAKKTGLVSLSYFVTHVFTNHTFSFSKDVKKRLLIILWETRRIYGHDSKMLSPLIVLPDYFLYSSVVWWCSKWWVQGWRGQWGLKGDHGGPRWGWLLCCPENRPWFPGTMQLMRNSPRKICVWHHGFLKLAAEPTLSCHNQLPVNFHCWPRERSRGRGWKGVCRGVDVACYLVYTCSVVWWLET